jgi:hypothetical protein
MVVGDAAAGTSLPWVTANGFSAATQVATAPFAAAEDIASHTCFFVNKNTTRHLVACGTAAAAGLRIGYSDDNGATWTTVALNLVATEMANHGGALFSLDSKHIWLVTNLANVFFSSDGGLTWTDQNAPAQTANQVLNAVKFLDKDVGFAVGGEPAASSVIIWTTDGGVHWTDLTNQPQAQAATGVAPITDQQLYVSYEDGDIWYSDNFQDDVAGMWDQVSLPITPDALGDIDFIDPYMGAATGYITVGGNEFPITFITRWAGAEWEYHQGPVTYDGAIEYYGQNALWICDYNHVYSVGEIIGAEPTIQDIAKYGN